MRPHSETLPFFRKAMSSQKGRSGDRSVSAVTSSHPLHIAVPGSTQQLWLAAHRGFTQQIKKTRLVLSRHLPRPSPILHTCHFPLV